TLTPLAIFTIQGTHNGYKNIGRIVVSASFGPIASIVSVDKFEAPKCPTFHTRDRYQKSSTVRAAFLN
ncbi:hypothetical protein, partial [uncultured Roseivirga sp.]|uniref:hypothetical protein n=1 Tax=uncultured Roseivirga sp. TaxID=543088 RepID=UPI0025977B07